jgi:hypothetical protein
MRNGYVELSVSFCALTENQQLLENARAPTLLVQGNVPCVHSMSVKIYQKSTSNLKIIGTRIVT